ncbi:hypothetical protein BCV69DRAFT_298744 [Microstroma glucosiphilum]|uniref:Uncharacterized protein n=1 Tax=Pseudomicrostroma glucosiphilum TaxID=1684307 RepID=A0A316UD23_9BASI|nr:hypothetical protein BCV69DRAFT_298744 [Pseudomicrostroma glucosiphilum]PWN20945.1 hypothetical protein BCV69DRAFT_298744 [Pseudomicrostroma glucosiphilum]
MSIQASDSSGPPTGKRKRTTHEDHDGDHDPQSTASTSRLDVSASQLAANLRTTSPDSLRQSLTSLRQATHTDDEETTVGPNDKRLVFARDFLEAKGLDRLFEAWTRIDDMKLPSLQAQPVVAIANLIKLTASHFTDQELCLNLIRPILPHGVGDLDATANYWHLLTSYLIGIQASTTRPGQQPVKTDEALNMACLQLLTNIVRFQSGRFARVIAENFPWSAKTVAKLAVMRRRQGKGMTGKTNAPSKAASLSKPDSRVSFMLFLTAMLHPATLPEYHLEDSDDSVDSGAATSTKLLLLGSDYALPHLSAFLKTLADDHTSNAARLLHVLERSVLRDPKLPRGSLISLVRSSDVLSVLLQTEQKPQHGLAEVSMQMLRELCGKAGRGICFRDQGWYGRSATGSAASDMTNEHNSFALAAEGDNHTIRASTNSLGIFNPLLDSFIVSPHFSPLYNTAHRDLLLEILSAAKELQPIYLSSTRGALGGGRLEPPASGSASNGATSGGREGARLSGVLANRLMGQLLDLDLPSFKTRRPPPLSRLLPGLLPPTLARSNFMKGLRHHDRLVRWSTLDLLRRVLGRVLRFLAGCALFSQREQSWAVACKAVSKEVVRRLPDVATVLSCLEGVDGKTRKSDEQTTSPVDHIMVEASLRVTSLLLEVLASDQTSSLVLNYDVRKLVSLTSLGKGSNQRSTDSNDSGLVQMVTSIELHTLRILRLSRAHLFSMPGSSDGKVASGFASMVLLSLSAEANASIKEEVTLLLMAAAGAAEGEGSSGLLFDGDQGELEAWLASLPSVADDSSSDAVLALVTLIEECLTRCSRNTYRYLEAARKARGSAIEGSGDDNSLPVSPMLTTFLEQASIKFQKDLLPGAEVRLATLQYLTRLVALLCGRKRVGAANALAGLLAQVATETDGKLTEEELWFLQVAQEVVRAIDPSHSSSQIPSAVERTSNDDMSSGRHTIDDLSRQQQRPVASSKIKALLSAMATQEGPDPSAANLLLLHPSKENVLPCLKQMFQAKNKPAVPASVTILHSLYHKVDEAAMTQITLLPDRPPLAKLSLRLILTGLAQNRETNGTFFLHALQSVASSSVLPPSDIGDLFFLNPQLTLAFAKGRVELAPLVDVGLKMFDPADASERVYLRPLIEAVLTRLDDSMREAAKLLPYFEIGQLQQVWTLLVSQLRSWRRDDQVTEGATLLRKTAQLLSPVTSGIDGGLIETLLALLAKQCKSEAAQDAVAGLLCDLLPVDGLDSFTYPKTTVRRGHSLARHLNGASLTGVVKSGISGGDALQARLIYHFPAAVAKPFADITARSSRALLRSRPMSLRSLVDVISSSGDVAEQAPLPSISHLAELCYDPVVGQVFSDCVGLICETDKCDEVLSTFPADLKPGDAFKLPAIQLATRLAKGGKRSQQVTAFVQRLLDQGLLWLVRRFAEDESDDEELLVAMEAFTALVHHASTNDIAKPRSHLADPVIEAGIKRRLTERRPMELIRALLRYTSLSASSASALFSTLLAHPQFSAVVRASSVDIESASVAEPVGRLIVVSCLYNMVSQHPAHLLTSQNVQALVSIYGGTLTLSDRLISSVLEMVEQHNPRVPLSSLVRNWSAEGSSPSSSAPLALDALLSLQPNRVFNTCAAFPRSRTYGHLQVQTESADKEDLQPLIRQGGEAYDPLWILSLLGASLSEDVKTTGLQWLSILRTCSVGVAVCALSSKSVPVRRLALSLMQNVYASIHSSDLQERDHILLALDSLRSSLSAPEGGSSVVPPPLPLTTTLFFAHHFRLLASPSSIFYPVSSRFLLQRSAFDTSDVPMLYNMLQSTDAEHWRAHRLWMLRFLRDTLLSGGGTLDWRVMKRRYVWDLLASMYSGAKSALVSAVEESEPSDAGSGQQSNGTLATLRLSLSLIEEVMLAAVGLPGIAVELITRKAFLSWLSQQAALDRLKKRRGDGEGEAEASEGGNSIWLVLLHRALKGVSLERLDRSTAGTWVLSTLDLLSELPCMSNTDRLCVIETLALIVEHLQGKAGEEGDAQELAYLGGRLVPLLAKVSLTTLLQSSEQAQMLFESCSRVEDMLKDSDHLERSILASLRAKLLELVLKATDQGVMTARFARQREELRRDEVRKLSASSPVTSQMLIK